MARRLLLLAIAFLLAVFVAWALFGQTYRLPRRPVVQVQSPLPQASSAATVQPSPSATTGSASPLPSATPGAFTVAIIIDDAGQWPTTERGYLALPIPLTLSVLPHVRYTAQIAQEAADAGKGVMLHLPMEPLGRDTAGPGEITTKMSDAQIAAQTEDDIAQVPLAKGLNNHEGSKASADSRVMRDVMAVVKSHDLFFIDSRTNAESVGAQVAQEAGVPAASRTIFLDNKADVAYTERMLELTVAAAKRDGSAIAIGHPRPTTLAALQAMYLKMQAEGVQFVLASELTH
jgi:polysaccharide deacetylase 2 family uncharacterized protein YibQ